MDCSQCGPSKTLRRPSLAHPHAPASPSWRLPSPSSVASMDGAAPERAAMRPCCKSLRFTDRHGPRLRPRGSHHMIKTADPAGTQHDTQTRPVMRKGPKAIKSDPSVLYVLQYRGSNLRGAGFGAFCARRPSPYSPGRQLGCAGARRIARTDHHKRCVPSERAWRLACTQAAAGPLRGSVPVLQLSTRLRASGTHFAPA